MQDRVIHYRFVVGILSLVFRLDLSCDFVQNLLHCLIQLRIIDLGLLYQHLGGLGDRIAVSGSLDFFRFRLYIWLSILVFSVA